LFLFLFCLCFCYFFVLVFAWRCSWWAGNRVDWVVVV
jgi:hypothetical protein